MESSLRARARAAAVTALSLALACAAPAAADQQQNQWEMQVGQREFQKLAQRGEIVQQSPYYQVLQPIAERIARVADPQYFTPFHFYLVNERSPNAFAVPGGNVYVTTSMMSFAKNQDELAGVLCHEVSHDIHHDVYNNTRKDQGLQTVAGILGMLMGNSGLGQLAVGLGATAQHMTYSRAVESAADRAGAYTCAQAGFNPHGMVWLFDRYAASKSAKSQPEMLSDHPRDDHRIADLDDLFRSDPATFGRFSDDVATGKPLAVPQQVARPQNPYGQAQNPYYPQPQPGQYGPPPQQPPYYGPPR
jgi:predicted Zn-dependent protease